MPFEKIVHQERNNINDKTQPTLQLGKPGLLTLNSVAYRLLGEPTYLTVYLDQNEGLIGVEKAPSADKNKFKVSVTKNGLAVIRVPSLFRLIESGYSSPIRAVANLVADTILAAPILPKGPPHG